MIVNAFNEVNWDIFKKGVGFSVEVCVPKKTTKMAINDVFLAEKEAIFRIFLEINKNH